MKYQKGGFAARLCALTLLAALGTTGVVCSAAMNPQENTTSKVTVTSSETYFTPEPPPPVALANTSNTSARDSIPDFAIPHAEEQTASNTSQPELVPDERLSDLEMVWPAQDVMVVISFLGYTSHTGMDIIGKKGDPVYAMAAGEVIFAKWNSSYGYLVVINHGDGVVTRYAHSSKLLVQEGDAVTAGQLIAEIGQTGRATGPHLHIEVMVDGRLNDPALYLSDKAPKA